LPSGSSKGICSWFGSPPPSPQNGGEPTIGDASAHRGHRFCGRLSSNSQPTLSSRQTPGRRGGAPSSPNAANMGFSVVTMLQPASTTQAMIGKPRLA
jgi:hypothetical protein